MLLIIAKEIISELEKQYRTNIINSLSGFKSARLDHETRRIARLAYAKPGVEPKEL